MALPTAFRGDRATTFTATDPRGRSLRVMGRTFTLPELETPVTIVVAAPADEIEKSVRNFANILALALVVLGLGLIGAVVGHILLGKAISMFSLFGLIALAGVVVNDSLIMVDFINKARAEGKSIKEAVIQSGTLRFRAIVLTSLTTAVGLMPIMFEKSVQAQYVTPMAIAMAFGIVFATVITLFLIPALYMLLIDWGFGWQKLRLLLLGKEAEYESLTKQV